MNRLVLALLSLVSTTRAANLDLWSHQPLQTTAPPAIQNTAWPRTPVDPYILAKLEHSHLTPAPDAAPIPLLRRIHYVLTGLPPSPHAAKLFQSRIRLSGLDTAITATVDSLLPSRAFAERWARHWLDVVRFAESSGRESNLTFPHAWRFRDYVIDSLHQDKPINTFLTEQLAGDLLPTQSPAQRAERLVATGFLALGSKGLNEMNPAQFIADLIDEQIDTTTRAFLAQSIACARCHDHKTDPYSMEDYYALAGIFLSTRTFFGTAIGSENNVGGELIQLPPLPGQLIPNASFPATKVAEMKAKVDALNREESEKRAAVAKALAEGRNPEGLFTLGDALRILWTRGGLEGTLRTVDHEGHALPLCMGVTDHPTIRSAPLLTRGEITHPTAPVPRAFPAALANPEVQPPPDDQSGRLQLAQWITHRRHPLTARVFVNRVWHHVFGSGLVATVDDFGHTGAPPSHPELLDHLAHQFIEDGWSLRQLVRSLVLSHTFRQDSLRRDHAFHTDPDNRLLWRMPQRRLDAEILRDHILAVSGRLNPTPREHSLIAPLGDASVSLFGFNQALPNDLDNSLHRSIYLPVVRDRMPDSMDLFDVAEPSLVTGARDVTTVAPQALYLLNSPFLAGQASAFAHRVFPPSNRSATPSIRRAFQLAFNRPPTTTEEQAALAFLQAPQGTLLERQTAFCQSLFCSAEFRFID